MCTVAIKRHSPLIEAGPRILPSFPDDLADSAVSQLQELGVAVQTGAKVTSIEPGLVQRLDNDTSGLLMVARNQPAFEILRDALRDGKITKSYLLICKSEDLADSGTIEIPIVTVKITS